MGIRSKRKGYNGEREVVEKLHEAGLSAKRVPLSGGAEGFEGDVKVMINNKEYTIEVKRRENGFLQLYKWLKGKDMLFCRKDREDWIVIMKIETFREVIGNKL